MFDQRYEVKGHHRLQIVQRKEGGGLATGGVGGSCEVEQD